MEPDNELVFEYVGPNGSEATSDIHEAVTPAELKMQQIIDQKQATIEELNKQILYLKKKTALQRDMLDTELNITQSLELNVHTLEKANQRLHSENRQQQNTIETLTAANDTLESKCDDLVKQLNSLNRQLNTLQRQHEKLAVMQRREAEAAASAAAVDREIAMASHQRLTRPRQWWPPLDNSVYGTGSDSMHCRSPATTGSFLSASPNFASSSLYGDVGDVEEGVGSSSGSLSLTMNECGVQRPTGGFSHEVCQDDEGEQGLFVTRRQHNQKQQHIIDLEYEISELIQENNALRLSKSIQQEAEFITAARSLHEELLNVDHDDDDAEDQHHVSTTTRALPRHIAPQYRDDFDDIVVAPHLPRPASPIQIRPPLPRPESLQFDEIPPFVQRPAAPIRKQQSSTDADMVAAQPDSVRSLVHLYESLVPLQPEPMTMTVPRTRSLFYIPVVTVTDTSPAPSPAADLLEPTDINSNAAPRHRRRLSSSCHSLIGGDGEKRSFMQQGTFASAVAALKAAGLQMTGPDEDARRSRIQSQ